MPEENYEYNISHLPRDVAIIGKQQREPERITKRIPLEDIKDNTVRRYSLKFYPNALRIMDVNKLIHNTNQLPSEEVDINKINKKSVPKSRRSGFDQKRYDKADLSYPILVDKDYYLLNGRHRYWKTKDQGNNKIKVTVVPDDIVDKSTVYYHPKLKKLMNKQSAELEYSPPYDLKTLKRRYPKLLNDPVHHWRAQNGIELIHKEPDIDEIKRIWNNWNLMDQKQKELSDKKSLNIFGLTNREHYKKLINTYMNKQSAETTNAVYENIIKPVGLAIAGLAIPAVGYYFIQNSLKNTMKDPNFKNKDTFDIIQKAKEMAHIDDVPHKVLPDINNAFYIPANTISEDNQGIWKNVANHKLKSKNDHEKANGNLMLSIVDMSNKPKGGIIVGENLDNPYVVGHELGHAIINREGSFYSFLQKYAPILTQTGALATFGSIVPWAMQQFVPGLKGNELLKDINKYMFWGGIGTTTAGLAGQVGYEYGASSKAKELMNQMPNINPAQKEVGEKALNLALGTYVTRNLRRVMPWLLPRI